MRTSGLSGGTDAAIPTPASASTPAARPSLAPVPLVLMSVPLRRDVLHKSGEAGVLPCGGKRPRLHALLGAECSRRHSPEGPCVLRHTLGHLRRAVAPAQAEGHRRQRTEEQLPGQLWPPVDLRLDARLPGEQQICGVAAGPRFRGCAWRFGDPRVNVPLPQSWAGCPTLR